MVLNWMDSTKTTAHINFALEAFPPLMNYCILYEGLVEVISFIQKLMAPATRSKKSSMGDDNGSNAQKKGPLPVTVLSGFLVSVQQIQDKTYILM